MSGLQETVSSLKDEQFKLILSNKQNTKEYKNLSDELDKSQSILSSYSDGVSRVKEQFCSLKYPA